MLAELDSPLSLQLLGKPKWDISPRNHQILNNLNDLETCRETLEHGAHKSQLISVAAADIVLRRHRPLVLLLELLVVLYSGCKQLYLCLLSIKVESIFFSGFMEVFKIICLFYSFCVSCSSTRIKRMQNEREVSI